MTDLLSARRASERFRLPGRSVASVTPHGKGLVHRTFAVWTTPTTPPHTFLLQQISSRVFPDPHALMDNVSRVLDHLRSSPVHDPSGSSPCNLTIIPTWDGCIVAEVDGTAWRMMTFVENAKVVGHPVTPFQAHQIGFAFGSFLEQMESFPWRTLHPTVPGYRDTAQYVAALRQAVSADPLRRARGAKDEIAFFMERTEDAMWLQRLADGGSIPLRTVHGDTKLDNVLLDVGTDRALCVIDLDTVSGGLLLHDLADGLRELLLPRLVQHSGITDEDQSVFAALLTGFLAPRSSPLSACEADHVVTAILSMALELGIRFLTDHLLGDRYFACQTPGMNLSRACAHRRLVERLCDEQQRLESLVERCVAASAHNQDPGWPATPANGIAG